MFGDHVTGQGWTSGTQVAQTQRQAIHLLEKHHRGGEPAPVDVHGFQAPGPECLKGTFTQRKMTSELFPDSSGNLSNGFCQPGMRTDCFASSDV